MAIDELDREKRRRIKELEKRREKLLGYLKAVGGYDADIEGELDEIDDELTEIETESEAN
jgi:hypothetical protein